MALRLPRARAVRARGGPSLQPAQAAARPLRARTSIGELRWSDALFGYTRRQQARGPVVRPPRQRRRHAQVPRARAGLHLGRRPPPARAVARHGDLRAARARLHHAHPDVPRARCAAPMPALATRAGDRPPAAPRRDHGRAAAGARLRRRPPPGRARACATTGATTRSASSRPETRYARRGKVNEFKTMVKTLHARRHRGDPRRGLQPHRRRQPARADAVLARHRQRRPTTSPERRRPALLRRLHRLRQHAQPASTRACCSW